MKFEIIETDYKETDTIADLMKEIDDSMGIPIEKLGNTKPRAWVNIDEAGKISLHGWLTPNIKGVKV